MELSPSTVVLHLTRLKKVNVVCVAISGLMVSNKNVWLNSEGDKWFERNMGVLGKRKDMVSFVLDLYKIKPKKIVEIGCSNGHRLAALHTTFGSEVIGIEPSEKAIEDGKAKWPFIKFIRATSDSFELGEKADVVILNFVLHWVERGNLIKSVAKLDEILESNGFAVICDFGVDYFFKRKYHHLPQEEMFTYKQPYQNILVSTGLYEEIARIGFNHDTNEVSHGTTNSNKAVISLLKKTERYISDNP